MEADILIILPVHNRRNITEKYILSLKKQNVSYHLLLLDDGSTDGTEEMVRSHIGEEKLSVVRGVGDWWWGGSIYQGYLWVKEKIASGQLNENAFVFFSNDDLTFEEGFLEEGMFFLNGKEKTLLLAGGYDKNTKEFADGGVHVNWALFKFTQTEDKTKINCLSTRALIFRAKDFVEIGGGNPKILPHYLSDYDFTLRAARKGFTLSAEKNWKIYVDFGATGYHKIRERSFLVFLKKFFSKKSEANPVTWSAFVMLAVPFPWKISVFLLVWLRAFVKISEGLLYSFGVKNI